MRLGVLFVLAACGDVTNNKHIADAPPGDGTSIDAPSAMVTVTMKHTAGAIVGTKVYFQANDSSVIATIATDANGVATAPMPNGGFVTVIDPDVTGEIRTWAGVKNGDSLTYDTSSTEIDSTVTFNIPRYVAPNGVTYTISTPCGSAANVTAPVGALGAFPVSVGLTCGPTTDVLVETRDPNLKLLSSFFVADQAITNNGTVDYSTKTYTAATTRSITLNNNTSLKSWTIEDDFENAQGDFFNGSATGTAANPSTASIVEPALPANVLDLLLIQEVVGTTVHAIETWGSTGGTVALDVSTMLLPDFSGAPAFDVASHTIAWTQAAESATPDYSLGLLGVTRGNTRFTWEMVTPTTTAVGFPVLVDDAAMYNVLGSDTVAPRVLLEKSPGGYDAVRPTVFGSGSEPPGATGTILVSTYKAMLN